MTLAFQANNSGSNPDRCIYFQKALVIEPYHVRFQKIIDLGRNSFAPDFPDYCRDIQLYRAVFPAFVAGQTKLKLLIFFIIGKGIISNPFSSKEVIYGVLVAYGIVHGTINQAVPAAYAVQ